MNYHIKPNVIQMNEPWHIPRASLSSISNSENSQQSHSNSSSYKSQTKKIRGQTNGGYNSEGGSTDSEHEKKKRLNRLKNLQQQKQSNTLEKLQNRFDDYSSRRTKTNNESNVVPKRGSRSSQGSTDSNHSSHSASSGSLLLTAANLEHFARINKNLPQSQLSEIIQIDPSSVNQYNTNITLSTIKQIEGTNIPIDPNLMHVKTKDLDTISIASSTHFTVVNGMGGPQRKIKNGLCSRGHQITVLILSMSFVFLVGIVGAVFFLELRARDMPH